MGYLTAEDIRLVETVGNVASVLSMLGSSFIIFCYWYFRNLRKFAFKLVLMLSITDFLNQATDFLAPKAEELVVLNSDLDLEPTSMCLAQAWTESIFELSSVLWTTSIAATLLMSVQLRWPSERIEGSFKYMLLVCYGFPLLVTLIPGLTGAFGAAGAWCWVTDRFVGWRFAQFYIPLLLAVLFNAFVYWSVVRIIQQNMQGAAAAAGARGIPGAARDPAIAQMQAVIGRLKWYPMILIGVWFFAFVNRIVEWSSSGDQVVALFVLQKFFSSLQGFWNAFAYGFSGGVREAIRQSTAQCCEGGICGSWYASMDGPAGGGIVGRKGAKTRGGLEDDIGEVEVDPEVEKPRLPIVTSASAPVVPSVRPPSQSSSPGSSPGSGAGREDGSRPAPPTPEFSALTVDGGGGGASREERIRAMQIAAAANRSAPNAL